MEPVLHLLAGFLVVAAVLPWARKGRWWIRTFDFPRLQFVAIGGVVLLLYRWVPGSLPGAVLQLLLVAATGYQLLRIRPFTRLGPVQVEDADEGERRGHRFRLLIANVLRDNRESARLLELVEQHQPDLFLAVETDEWWQQQLDVLAESYPYAVRYPLPNTYGMSLFSRCRLIRPEVRFLVQDDVPSIDTAIELADAPNIHFYAIHPRPPRPLHWQHSINRDAELVIVGQQLTDRQDPVIVAGDLNDVAWSYTTDLFQRLSGLLDPRRGRGMFNSFNAKVPFMRFPLDHVFLSEHFRLVRLERLPKFGSDHFPILVEVSYQKDAALAQNTPDADGEDLAMAAELRRRALE